MSREPLRIPRSLIEFVMCQVNNSYISRPFAKPPSGRIAVKLINHLGSEVMKVFRVD